MLYELIQASVNEKNIEGLKEIHELLYNHLVGKEFLVPNDQNELDKVKILREKIDFKDDEYHIIINPTMNCNFKCWYCYETHIKGSRMSSQTIDKVNYFIENTILKNKAIKKLQISWFGGEPLLYFDSAIIPILRFAKRLTSENKIHFSTDFTTNGFLLSQKRINDLKEFNVNNIQITLDGDEQRHDKVRFVSKSKGSYRKIINNIKLLCKNKILNNVRINYSKGTLTNINSIMSEFANLTNHEREFVRFSFHKVWQEKANLNREVDLSINEFRNSGFSVTSNNSTDTFRNSCYADKKNQATINYNGDVYKCTARDFKKENVEGELLDFGEIKWNSKFDKRMDIKFKNKPCLTCRILPICNGGCSQNAIENEGRDYCVVEDAGRNKTDIVYEKFLTFIS